MWERCTIHNSFSDAIDPPLWLTKKRPSQGWRLGRFGGSAGRTARRICVLSGATLPPIARLTLSHRYSRILALPALQKTRGAPPIASRPPLLAEAGSREATSARNKINGVARKYQFLCIADVGVYNTRTEDIVARIYCLAYVASPISIALSDLSNPIF